ncbi:hypothetical protein CPB85DRAFT_1277089 [Mucidula mucida]|nr:hypothetical protein CPB85DRAFT_1277089 [Mucidula mucida]
MLYMLRLLPEIHCLEVSSTFGNGRDWCIWTHIYRLSSHFHDARRPLSGAFKVVFSTGCLNEYITKSFSSVQVTNTPFIMPRRSPPSALRLVPGPAPPRNVPKHTLPSVPRPTFYWPCNLGKGPTPRSSNRSPLYDEGQDRLKLVSKRSVRGPWDHSGSIPLKFDVDRLIRAPQPVAMSVQ